MADSTPLRHLRVDDRASAHAYTSPRRGGGSFRMPARERAAHGANLVRILEQIESGSQTGASARTHYGVILVFQSSRQYELALQSLESVQAGIELLSVRERDGIQQAVVFVPQGRLGYFLKKFRDYIDKPTRSGKPSNQKLVESIDQVAVAALDQLWNDDGPFPGLDDALAWEVWLRSSDSGIVQQFRGEAATLGLEVSDRQIMFLDRCVVMVRGTARQLSQSIALVDLLAELRRAKECPTDYIELAPSEQARHVAGMTQRLRPPAVNAVAVCLLDTGVHAGHPLLAPAIDGSDVLTCFPGGSAADHSGHGTEMAGLSLYGDLVKVIATAGPIALDHRLESVQIIPRVGANHPDVYGAITAEAVARIGVSAPLRQRVVCLTTTTTDFRDRGQPSSWSAELDQISLGSAETPPQLILVSAGNTDGDQRPRYPHSNYSEGIHDPGQSWNALTVGAFTEKVLIQSPTFAGYEPMAAPGGLCPSSSTALIWQSQWPIKPDLVMEGGNFARSPEGHADSIEDLQLLTTGMSSSGRLLVASGDTSAATALAARQAARIQTSYPHYWPETVRGLLVHSAQWTEAMRQDFRDQTAKRAVESRLRCFGYGVPDLDRALWCAANALTLVSQVEIQPFEKSDGRIKTKHMHLYELPWPHAELQQVGDQLVTVRVTLSYFVEPSPGRRGWKYRHRYASHGLRFDLKKPTESLPQFQARLNRQARDEDEGITTPGSGLDWAIGAGIRNRGSLHSDWWTGTAAELAECGYLGVYPVTGWWRERPQFERWNRSVRYSLIVSLTTPRTDIDLYTPVANQVAISVPAS